MEKKFIYKLKRPLVFPVSKTEKRGYVVYNSRDFGIGYNSLPNPRDKVLVVSLAIFELETGQLVQNIDSYVITESGFPTNVIVNQAEIDAARQLLSDVQSDITKTENRLQSAYAEEAAAVVEGATQETLDAIKATIQHYLTELEDLRNQLQAISIPAPEILYINKYSDIIKYFSNDGSITEEGVVWAKTIPFLGLTIGDYIE